MRPSSCIALLLCCIALWYLPGSAYAELSSACSHALQQFVRQRVKESAPYKKENVLYFLHVPRTAGRTFHTCLLKLGTPPAHRCPKSYDSLRVDGATKCRLLSSHDDFSVVDLLPHDISVVSQLRDPVDRILSAYEFAVEVAARNIDRPPSTNITAEMAIKARVTTENVWPWSLLVPFFIQDMQDRKARMRNTGTWLQMSTKDGRQYLYNRELNMTRWPNYEDKHESILPRLNPYDNPLFMPLAQFIEHPIAQELLHEGALLQVLGLTNYSHYPEAAQLRKCLFQEPEAQAHLLHKAVKRLETFTHVGTTDMLKDAVVSAAASLEMPLDGPSYRRSDPSTAGRRLQGVQQLSAPERARQPDSFWDDEEASLEVDQMQGLAAQRDMPSSAQRRQLQHKQATLASDYLTCVAQAKDRNQRRRNMSLRNMKTPDGRGFTFSKEARDQLPASIIQAIRDKNKGDLTLYERAKQLLAAKREQHLKAGKLIPLNRHVKSKSTH